MKLRPVILRVLWYCARVLVYAKRGFFSLFSFSVRGFEFINNWYKKTIGFAIFKASFYIRKRLFPETNRPTTTQWYWLGERWVLQLIIITAGLFLALPHTTLHEPEFGEVPGRKTLLYSLVGPGEQDFSSVDDVISDNSAAGEVLTDIWKEGSVTNELTNEIINSEDSTPTTNNGALIKPYFVAIGGLIDSRGSSNGPIRNQTINHVVQTGEVLGGIAKKYSLNIETVLSTNNLTTKSVLRPGANLIIPPADGILYKVKRGDTVSSIAKTYGVSAAEITKFNGLKEKALTVGAQILVPGARRITPIVAVKPVKKPTNTGNNSQSTGPINIPPPSAALGTYIWPTGAKIVTQYYGLQHTGMDIAGPTGLPNYATRDGVVTKSQCGYNGGYGCMIIVDHGGGITSWYGHNNKLLVSVGEHVSQGQVIGILGNTGRSTGPHLHFEIRVNGKHVNPLQYIRR